MAKTTTPTKKTEVTLTISEEERNKIITILGNLSVAVLSPAADALRHVCHTLKNLKESEM